MEQRTETKIERVILRHLSGSKAGRADKLELNHPIEITIGRNPSSHIAYDPDKDDLVSTNHANIAWDEASPSVFTLTDLGSRNGTFVNNQRVSSPVRLRLGDLIQLGPGGPKMEFDCEPRPMAMIKTTRMASSESAALPGARAIK